jgi:hypothetical protein
MGAIMFRSAGAEGQEQQVIEGQMRRKHCVVGLGYWYGNKSIE